MGRRVLCRAAVASLLALTACTGTSPNASPPPTASPSGSHSTTGTEPSLPPPAVLRASHVVPALLDLEDMKSGWSARKAERTPFDGGFSVCNRKPYKGNTPVFEVVRILDGPGQREAWHTIRPFGSIAKASRLVQRWRAAAEACHSYRDTDEGRNYNVRIISFGDYGDEVVAVEVRGGRTSEYVPYTFFYVLVQQGQFVSAFRLQTGQQFEFLQGFESDIEAAEALVEVGTEKLAATVNLDLAFKPIPIERSRT